MSVLLTRAEMQSLDRIAIDELGIPSLVLMEVAGRAVADHAEAAVKRASNSPHARVLAVSGLGNNGGDAVVAARHLRDRGVAVTLALAGDPAKASKDLKHELSIAAKLGITPIILGDIAPLLEKHEVVIDGLFGTGLARAIDGLNAAVIGAINAANKNVIAVDIASGIDADTGRVLGTAIRAQTTVTFQHAKLGHLIYPGREHTGALAIADIGIPRSLLARVPDAAELIEASHAREALPDRRADSHKGTYGHLLIAAGLPDRPGAALLCMRASQRIGAGLVTLASDEETIRRLAPVFEQGMGLSAGRERIDPAKLIEACESKTALAIGPSLTGDRETARLVRETLEASKIPAVLDAGALAAIGRDLAWLRARGAPTILTPHPGEAGVLAGLEAKQVQADRLGVARAIAAESGAIVVLKGASTIVAAPNGRVAINATGNAGMASGGTGDVLTGMIGGLLAQKVEPLLAAKAAVYLHGAAGDRAAAARGGRIVASDLIEAL